MKINIYVILISNLLIAYLIESKLKFSKIDFKKNDDWYCIPGERVGFIKLNSTEEELKKVYKAHNVKRGEICIGEGTWVTGTILFPKTKNELQVTWLDTVNFKRPNYIIIKQKDTQWKTLFGITIGTTLKEIEKLNKKSFNLVGFSWDYAGTITNWNNGILEYSNSLKTIDFLSIRLDGDSKLSILHPNDAQSLLGDKELVSSNNLLQRLNPAVSEIIIYLNN